MNKADAGLTGRLFFSHVTGSGGKQEAGGDFLFHHTQSGEGSFS